MNILEVESKLKKIGIYQKDLIEILIREGEVKVLDKKTPIIKEGSYIKQISIVLDGEVRVWKNSEEGKQILLTPNFSQPKELADILMNLD